jgi:1-acyl-sn-glycerol-3-phosphate acyltransferase
MEPWRYETVPDLDQALSERLRRFPRQPDMLVYGLRSAVALSLRGWLRLYHRLTVEGRDHLPAEGSFVMVANHSSHLDALCLISALPLAKLHRAFPAAAQDYFFVSLPRLAVAAVLVNALPFDREVHVRQTLDLCRELLANPGNVLMLFPEGTRSVTGEIGAFKPGIGRLLAGADVPVVPCYLHGAFAAWPKGRLAPRPHKLRLTIGRPRRYPDLPPDKASARRICAELEDAVKTLAVHPDPVATTASGKGTPS